MADESKGSSTADQSKGSSTADESKRISTPRCEPRARESSTQKAIIAGIAMKEMDPADIIAILEMQAAAGNQEHAIRCFQNLKHTKRSSATSKRTRASTAA